MVTEDPFRVCHVGHRSRKVPSVFVLWGTILLLIQVSVDSLSVYSIHDIEQRKRTLVQHVLQIILVLWLIMNCKGHNKSYTATIWIF